MTNQNHHDPTDEEVMDMIESTFGSLHNLLPLCGGSGTYLFLGPTESGKTSAIGSLYREAQSQPHVYNYRPIVFSTFIIISDTDEITDDLAWCRTRSAHFPLTDESITDITETRKLECIRATKKENQLRKGKNLPNVSAKEWANNHPICIILDDIYGKVDLQKRSSPVTALTTKARNYGIYLFVLAQGFNQAPPTIKQNARAIITFRLNAENHTELYKKRYGKPTASIIESLAKHNEQLYKPVVYIRTWVLSDEKYGSASPRVLLLPRFTPLFNKPKVPCMDSPRPLGERYRESMNNVIDKYSNMDMDMDESEGESLGEEDSYSEEEEEEEPMQSQVAEGWPHRKRQKT